MTRSVRYSLSAALLVVVPSIVPAQMLTPPPVVSTVSRPTGTSTPVAIKTKRAHIGGDPLEGINRALFSVHTVLDRILFRPVAIAYKTVVPKLLRTGIRHVLSNLTEPVVFVNDVLQLKPKRAARTLGRFAINTTLGIGGVIDVAKGEAFPHRENGFGDTLARYGVGPGPYLFIPLIGPNTLRDLAGGQADGAFLPRVVGNPFDRDAFTLSRQVLTGLDLRAENDAGYKALLDSAADPYATLRSVYLQGRAAEIAEIKGEPVGAGDLDDPLADPEGPGAEPSATTTPAGDTPADPAATPPIDTPADPEAMPRNDTPADPEPPASTSPPTP